jgi:fructose-1,6-bisphosphatase/inositol monophosphatase family enzyme
MEVKWPGIMNSPTYSQNNSYQMFRPLDPSLKGVIDASLAELLQSILRLSKEVILPKRQSAARHFKDDSWGGQEVVTSTDLAVSEALLSVARKSFVYSESEEHLSKELPKSEPFWQIDPIDGTKLYDPTFPDYAASQFEQEINGRNFRVSRQASNHGWGVMAALLEPTIDGGYLSRVAVLHRPVLEETWLVGTDGVVKRIRGEQSEIKSPRTTITTPIRAGIGTVYSPPEFELGIIENAFGNLDQFSLVDLGGAISYYAAFLNGEIDCFTFSDYGIKSWDFAAGYALLTAMGVKITDYSGQAIKNLCTPERRIRGGIRVSVPWINHR